MRNNDSINDETFGSTDYTTEDRAEEERKRRGFFDAFLIFHIVHIIIPSSFWLDYLLPTELEYDFRLSFL